MSAPWPAPAKINRFLHVVGRRPDGYHRLQTLFQFLDHCDEIEIRPRTDGVIERLGEIPGVPAGVDLTLRAARALQRLAPPGCGASIRVHKRLPIGGGIGGGSSDAATTLVALNHYWGVGLNRGQLIGTGLALGADLPAFIFGRTAWAEGVGEELHAVAIDMPWFVLIVPNARISTAEVFRDPKLTPRTPLITMRDFLAGRAENDLEAIVFRRFPDVSAAAQWLSAHGAARMTGSGGCVFAAFETREAAAAVAERVPRRWGRFVARGLDESPLIARLNDAIEGGE